MIKLSDRIHPIQAKAPFVSKFFSNSDIHKVPPSWDKVSDDIVNHYNHNQKTSLRWQDHHYSIKKTATIVWFIKQIDFFFKRKNKIRTLTVSNTVDRTPLFSKYRAHTSPANPPPMIPTTGSPEIGVVKTSCSCINVFLMAELREDPYERRLLGGLPPAGTSDRKGGIFTTRGWGSWEKRRRRSALGKEVRKDGRRRVAGDGDGSIADEKFGGKDVWIGRCHYCLNESKNLILSKCVGHRP